MKDGGYNPKLQQELRNRKLRGGDSHGVWMRQRLNDMLAVVPSEPVASPQPKPVPPIQQLRLPEPPKETFWGKVVKFFS